MKKIIISFVIVLLLTTISTVSADMTFPHADTNPPWGTEVGIINTSDDQTLAGDLNAFDNNGITIDSLPIILEPHARQQIDVGSTFDNPTSIRYLVLDTQNEDVQGYTRFFQPGIFSVAVPAVTEINTGDIYASHIASVAGEWWSGFSLVNTTNASVTPTITFDTGDTRDIMLEAGEHKAFTVAGLFDNVPQPNINSAIITNATGVVGLELFGSAGDGNQLSGIRLTDKTTETMYYAHTAGGSFWTGIVAYNPDVATNGVIVTPYTAAGTALATQSFDIASEEKFVGTVAGLGFPPDTAWFKIEADWPLTGFELFGTNDSNQMAGYTGVGIATQSGVFPRIEPDGWTGIAFANTQNREASVSLLAYDDGGDIVAGEIVFLDPFAKTVDVVENFFSQDVTPATYVEFNSNNIIVGFQLNGSPDNMLLDGLPALSTNNGGPSPLTFTAKSGDQFEPNGRRFLSECDFSPARGGSVRSYSMILGSLFSTTNNVFFGLEEDCSGQPDFSLAAIGTITKAGEIQAQLNDSNVTATRVNIDVFSSEAVLYNEEYKEFFDDNWFCGKEWEIGFNYDVSDTGCGPDSNLKETIHFDDTADPALKTITDWYYGDSAEGPKDEEGYPIVLDPKFQRWEEGLFY